VNGLFSDVEGMPEETLLLALFKMWTADMRGGSAAHCHLCPAVWGGEHINISQGSYSIIPSGVDPVPVTTGFPGVEQGEVCGAVQFVCRQPCWQVI